MAVELLLNHGQLAGEVNSAPVALTDTITVPAGNDRVLVVFYCTRGFFDEPAPALTITLAGAGPAVSEELPPAIDESQRVGVLLFAIPGSGEVASEWAVSAPITTARVHAQAIVFANAQAVASGLVTGLATPPDGIDLTVSGVLGGMLITFACSEGALVEPDVEAAGSYVQLFSWFGGSGGGALGNNPGAALAASLTGAQSFHWSQVSGDGGEIAGFMFALLPALDLYNCECVDERPERTLADLRVSLLRRLGFSAMVANPPPGMAALLDDFLRDAQEQLYQRYTAMRTERYFRWTMQPGVRFYGLRASEGVCDLRLDPYKITWVGIEDAGATWQPLHPGIHSTLYTGLQRGRPARYEVRQCIEVYPPPDRAYTLRVKGHFGLTAFTADTDLPTLPSHAIFLLALGNAKAHYGQADAGNYFGQSSSYVGGQVAGSHTTARYVPGATPAVAWTRPKIIGGDDEVP